MYFLPQYLFPMLCTTTAVSDKEHESNCRDLMEIAHTVMQEKQKGMSLKEMLERNDHANESESNQYLYEMIQLIIRDAFTQ